MILEWRPKWAPNLRKPKTAIKRICSTGNPCGLRRMLTINLMVVIDKKFLETSFYGMQQITLHFQKQGHVEN